jgi:hypothetical protein
MVWRPRPPWKTDWATLREIRPTLPYTGREMIREGDILGQPPTVDHTLGNARSYAWQFVKGMA